MALKKNILVSTFRETIPIAFGYFPSGIAYGILMDAAGFPLWFSVLASALIFTGSGQFSLLPLMCNGASLFVTGFNLFIISLRFMLYSILIERSIPNTNKLLRFYSSSFFADESFILINSLPIKIARIKAPFIIFYTHSYWVIATFLGGILGHKLGNLIDHLDFSLPCLFLILCYEQVKIRKIFWPLLLGFIGYCIGMLMSPDNMLLFVVIFTIIFTTFEDKLPAYYKIKNNFRGWSLLGILCLIISCLLFFNFLNIAHLNQNTQLDISYTNKWLIIILLISFLILIFLRNSVHFFPKIILQSKYLDIINQALPIAIMVALTLSCLHLPAFIQQHNLTILAEVPALLLMGLGYIYMRNVLFSMVIGITAINTFEILLKLII